MRFENFFAHVHTTRMVDLQSLDCSSVEYPRFTRLELPRACPPCNIDRIILRSSSHAFHQSQSALGKPYSAFISAKADRLCNLDCLMLRGWHRMARRSDIWGATASYLDVLILIISVFQSMPSPAWLEGSSQTSSFLNMPSGAIGEIQLRHLVLREARPSPMSVDTHV